MTNRPLLGLVIVGLGASMGPLDIAVNVALPDITGHFRLPLADVQWLVIFYVLTYGSLMLVFGKLGDLFGHRLIFRIGMVISAMGCAACALAPDWPLFLAARILQGVGTAMALSCTPALATSLFPPAERTRALAGFAAAMAFATAAGPFLGGVVTELWGWPAVYWMRVPIALAALGLGGLLPAPPRDLRPFDYRGAILLAACMCCVLMALVMSQRADAPARWTLAVLAAGAGLLWWYVRHSWAAPEPILRPGLFADPLFTVPVLINVLVNLAGFSVLLLTPYYLVNVLELSSVAAGLVLGSSFAANLASTPLAARLVIAIGGRPTAFIGTAAIGLALLPMGLSGPATPLALVVVLLVAQGIGHALLTVAFTDLVMGTLPERDRGVAGSLSLLTRTLGTVAGASVLSALHARGAAGMTGLDGFLAGYNFAFLAAAGGLLAALALSCLIPRVWFVR